MRQSYVRVTLGVVGLAAAACMNGCRDYDRTTYSDTRYGDTSAISSDTGTTGSSASPYTHPHKRSLITGVEEEPAYVNPGPTYVTPGPTYTTPTYRRDY